MPVGETSMQTQGLPVHGRAGARTQSGMALVVGLVFLVAMIMVGVASLRGTTLNEKMAANTQNKIISFQVSESSIQRVWNVNTLLNNTFPTPFHNPPLQSVDMAGVFDEPPMDIAARADIQYCGEVALPQGNSLNANQSGVKPAVYSYSVNGNGQVLVFNAFSQNEQRGVLTRPATGRGGNCPP